MDLVRSCYTTEMRFFKDSDLAIKVRWYFADEEAGIFPGYHRFASGNWASDRFDWPGPGEILDSPRIWNDGSPIDGLIGDHFCGPMPAYREGDVYPGVPLNGLPDGRCACCVPLPPSCADTLAPLPNTLRLRILNITLEPLGAPASIYVVGQEFDFNWTGLDPRAWLIDGVLSRDGCPFVNQLSLLCRIFGEETKLSLLSTADQIDTQAALIQEVPFRAWFNFVPIGAFSCVALGDGQEYWDVVIFDPADPPP